MISDRLQAQVDDLTQRLAQTDLADAGPLLDAFVRESGAEAALAAPGGAEADTGSLLVLPAEDWQVSVTVSGADNSVQTYDADTYQVQIDRADRVVTAHTDRAPHCPGHLRRPGGDLSAAGLSPAPPGQSGGGSPGTGGALAGPGPAGLLAAVRSGVFPLSGKAHRPYQRHRRKDGGAGFPVEVRRDPAG